MTTAAGDGRPPRSGPLTGIPVAGVLAALLEARTSGQPAPAPRFSRTPEPLSTPPPAVGADTRAALGAWGVADVDSLVASGAAVPAIPADAP